MVKRPKSPERTPDTKFFTVYQPYPFYPNFAINDEVKQCALWIAECIGPDYILAIRHRTQSRGMIILEIDPSFTEHERLLGEHRWSEMLKNPSDTERQHVSQIFHCLYSKDRDAQKDGWYPVYVKGSWFRGWQPGEREIRQPYPITHWCPIPYEDKTTKPLCRPLPVERKPPPPKEPKDQLPVVGSEQWVEKQVTGSSYMRAEVARPLLSVATMPPHRQGRSQSSQHQSPASAISPQSSGSSWFPPASGSNSNSSAPPSAVSPSASKPKNAWGKPVPLKQFNAPDQRSGKASWGPVPPTGPKDAKSPLLEEPPQGPVNAWTKPLKHPPSSRKPMGGAPTPSSNSNSNSNSPWSQASALAPASPWGTSTPLTTTPASVSPNDPVSQDVYTSKTAGSDTNSKGPNNSDRNGNAWGSKANKKRGGSQTQSPAQAPSAAAKDKPPHQQQDKPKKRWDEEESEDDFYVDVPPSAGGGGNDWRNRKVESANANAKDAEGEDESEDLENEFLHPWETNNAAAWGAPPASSAVEGRKFDHEKKGPSTNANGKTNQYQQRQGGQQKGARGQDRGWTDSNNGANTKWGDKGKNKSVSGGGSGRQNNGRDPKPKGKEWAKERTNVESASWKYEPTPSNSWGDEPIQTGNMDWKAESTPANSWGEAELKMDWTSTEPNASNSWGDAPLNQEEQENESSAAIEDKGKSEEAAPSDSMKDWGAAGGLNEASSSVNAWGMMEPNANEAQVDWSGAPIAQGDWGTLPVGEQFPDWKHPQNLWDEEESDEKTPELICPTHNIGCKKGICRDMARLVKEQERQRKMEEKTRGGGGRGGSRGRGRRGGYAGNSGGPSLDEEGFAKPHKRTRRGKKWYEKSFIGKMRAFGPDEDKEKATEDGETEDESRGENTSQAHAGQVAEDWDE